MNAVAQVPGRRGSDARATRRGAGRAAVVGVVLCGGASRRMGTDKALVELDGRKLLDRAREAVGAATDRVVLATGAEARYADLGAPIALDEPGTTGAAAGVIAGLREADADRALVVACDMPRLDAAVLRRLVDEAVENELDACFLVGERGREPLCAVYACRVADAMRAAQSRGDRRVVAFLDEAVTPAWRVGEVRAPDCARNLNTPEDVAEERARLSREREQQEGGPR